MKRLCASSILLSVTPSEAQSAEQVGLSQKHIIDQCMLWKVGASFWFLPRQAFCSKHALVYLVARWLKKKLVLFLFQCPLAGIVLLSEKDSKLRKEIGI